MERVAGGGAVLARAAVPAVGTPRFPLQPRRAPRSVVTAVVFLAVALVVGLLVGGATEDRARAARREREARLLGYLSTQAPDRRGPRPRARRLRQRAAGSVRPGVVRDHGGAGRAAAARAGASDPASSPAVPTAVVPLVVGTVAFGTLEVERPIGPPAAHAATSCSCWRRRRSRRPRRWTARGWTPGPASRSSTPRRTSCAPRCSPRSRTTCGRRSRRSRRASRACSTPPSHYDARAGARAAHDDPGGDRPPEPAGGQHPRPRRRSGRAR